MNVYLVKSEDEVLYYSDETKAYQKAMEMNFEQIAEYENIFTDLINKQSVKSIHTIQKLKLISDPKLQLDYYLKNLEEIYYYFYDGGNEMWQMWNLYGNIFSVEENILNN